MSPTDSPGDEDRRARPSAGARPGSGRRRPGGSRGWVASPAAGKRSASARPPGRGARLGRAGAGGGALPRGSGAGRNPRGSGVPRAGRQVGADGRGGGGGRPGSGRGGLWVLRSVRPRARAARPPAPAQPVLLPRPPEKQLLERPRPAGPRRRPRSSAERRGHGHADRAAAPAPAALRAAAPRRQVSSPGSALLPGSPSVGRTLGPSSPAPAPVYLHPRLHRPRRLPSSSFRVHPHLPARTFLPPPRLPRGLFSRDSPRGCPWGAGRGRSSCGRPRVLSAVPVLNRRRAAGRGRGRRSQSSRVPGLAGVLRPRGTWPVPGWLVPFQARAERSAPHELQAGRKERS